MSNYRNFGELMVAWLSRKLTGTSAPYVQLASAISGEDTTLNRLLTSKKYQWQKLTATALVFGSDGVVTPGILQGIWITDAGTGGTLAIYDADDTSTTTTPLPSPSSVTAGNPIWIHAAVTTGLAVVLGGSVAPTVWVAYEVGS